MKCLVSAAFYYATASQRYGFFLQLHHICQKDASEGPHIQYLSETPGNIFDSPLGVIPSINIYFLLFHLLSRFIYSFPILLSNSSILVFHLSLTVPSSLINRNEMLYTQDNRCFCKVFETIIDSKVVSGLNMLN